MTILTDTRKLLLIQRFKEGLEIYFCLTCKHKINKPVNRPLKDFRCAYCGQGA